MGRRENRKRFELKRRERDQKVKSDEMRMGHKRKNLYYDSRSESKVSKCLCLGVCESGYENDKER